jgi:hypothetical protein
MIQDIAWSPRFVPSTTATAATDAEAIAGTNTTKFVTPANLAAAAEYAVAQVINPRASRQGLVFDGTAGSGATLASAIGTSDVTFAAWMDVPSSNPSLLVAYYVATGNAWKPNDCAGYINTDGTLAFQLRGTLVGDTRIATVTANAVSTWGGKRILFTVRRTGTTLSIEVNGVSQAFTTAGSAITWANTIDGTTLRVGDISNNSSPFVGYLSLLIYNRALSAAEVVALYESGVPAGADYNTASNTALNTATFSNSNIYPYGTFSGASTTGFSAVSNGVSLQGAYANVSITFVKGAKYRLTYTLTVNSGTAPSVVLGNPGVAGFSAITALTAGTNTVEIQATSSGTSPQGFGFLLNAAAGDYSISSISLVRVGLLLAPDAGQAGGGLTWYDTSGNAANITLPASGVTWNVPTSGYWGGNLTVSSTGTAYANKLLRVLNGSSVSILTITGDGRTYLGADMAYNSIFTVRRTTGNPVNELANIGDADGHTLRFQSSSTQYKLSLLGSTGIISFGNAGVNDQQLNLNTATGNVLIGGTTDSGNGQIQLTDTSASASKGLGFGSDCQIYRAGGNTLKMVLGPGSVWFDNGGSGTGGARILGSSGALTITSNGANSLYLQTGGTTALTLDSSQNATFAGRTSAGTAYGTAKSVTVDYNVQTVTNVTRTFTVTMPSPSSGSTFLLEVGVYGNIGTGYSSLMVKGGGYVGNSLYYDATELVKVNSGNVTISSVTKSNGSMTFTVINTADVAICAVKFSQTSAAAFTTLPTITSA